MLGFLRVSIGLASLAIVAAVIASMFQVSNEFIRIVLDLTKLIEGGDSESTLARADMIMSFGVLATIMLESAFRAISGMALQFGSWVISIILNESRPAPPVSDSPLSSLAVVFGPAVMWFVSVISLRVFPPQS